MADPEINPIEENIFDEQKQEIINEAKEQALLEVEKYLATLPQEIEDHITKAIKDSMPVITLNHKGDKFLEKSWSATYIPPIITGIVTIIGILISFGFWAFYQSSTIESMSKKDKIFATELSLKEEYTKRQFDAYEEANILMSDLIDVIYQDALNAERKIIPDENKKLRILLQKKAVYLPKEVEDSIDKVIKNVISFYPASQATTTVKSIEDDVKKARDLLKEKMVDISIKLNNE